MCLEGRGGRGRSKGSGKQSTSRREGEVREKVPMLASPLHAAKWRAVLPLLSATAASAPFLTRPRTMNVMERRSKKGVTKKRSKKGREGGRSTE